MRNTMVKVSSQSDKRFLCENVTNKQTVPVNYIGVDDRKVISHLEDFDSATNQNYRLIFLRRYQNQLRHFCHMSQLALLVRYLTEKNTT